MEENPVLENLQPIDEKSRRQEKYLPLKNLVRQHPYWSAILLVIYAIIVLEFFRLIIFLIDFSPYKIPFVPGGPILELVLVLFWVFVPLYVLDWWHTPGFQTVLGPLRIRGYRVLFLGLFLVLGVIPVFLLTFSRTIHQTPLLLVVTVALYSLFVGIAEEGLFRGLVLNIVLPKGIWRAVLFSSLLFGGVHILNVFAGFPLTDEIIQVFSALGFGMFLAAVRLRTNSLRPGIIMHALWDFPLIVLHLHRQHVAPPTPLLALIEGGIVFAIYSVCTLIVLRPKKLRELRVMYVLVAIRAETEAYIRPS